jgi:hypothetical protein
MGLFPLFSISPADCERALVFHWITHFGVPDTITSVCVSQFTSNLWAELCDILNILHRQTTAYHPEANGAVKDCIAASRMHCVAVPPQLLGPRRSLGSSSNSIPSQGRTLVFPRLRQFFFTPLVLPNEILQAD